MTTVLETPDELLERLERMGLDRVRRLAGLNHFEPKARGLVKGWITSKEQELLPPPAPSEPAAADPVPQAAAPAPQTAEIKADIKAEIKADIKEALRMSQRAVRESVAAREAVAHMQRMNSIAIGTATVAAVVSILSLFALALTS